jgi:hypothetical protein
MFVAVQEERQRRSNVVIDENGVKQRASKRYSSKTVNIERNSKNLFSLDLCMDFRA